MQWLQRAARCHCKLKGQKARKPKKISTQYTLQWTSSQICAHWSFKSCATTIVSSSSVQQLYLSCPLYGVTTLTATLCPQLLMSDWSIMGGMFGCRAQWYYNYLIIVLLPLFAGVHSTISWAPTVVFTFAAGHNGHWTLFKIVLLCTHQHLTLPSPSPETFNS